MSLCPHSRGRAGRTRSGGGGLYRGERRRAGRAAQEEGEAMGDNASKSHRRMVKHDGIDPIDKYVGGRLGARRLHERRSQTRHRVKSESNRCAPES
jgi:hypothetical protein